MKLLIGSLGPLGYLVKPLPPGEPPPWRRFEDEAALFAHLRAENFNEVEIRNVLRSIRAEGRAVLSIADSVPPVVPARHRRTRPAISA
jgi:hypothetical protein